MHRRATVARAPDGAGGLSGVASAIARFEFRNRPENRFQMSSNEIELPTGALEAANERTSAENPVPSARAQ